MSAVYLNFDGQVMATSATPRAWLSTTAIGQTLTASSLSAQLGDGYGGGVLIGGSGDNTFSIVDSSELISVASSAGVNTVNSWASYALPTNVNNLVLEKADMAGTANSGSDLIIALGAGDSLIAGSGSDVLVDAGAGGDFFTIGANATKDVIYGFQASGANHDFIQLTGTNFTSFADVQANLSQMGADTLLTLSPTQHVLIRNTQVSSLTATDFALNLNLHNATPTFDDEFNSISLYNSSTGSGVWKTSFISGNQTGSQSFTSRTLAPNAEQEIYVDPSYAGNGSTALGLNPFSISNGVLTITAANTPTSDLAALSGFKYTSGLLTTEKSFSQTYGYFEMKAELPAGQGVWPAFWLLPTDGTWPPELDVMEQVGGGNVYETSHYRNASGATTQSAFATYVPGNTTGFHTYGVLWTSTTLSWYVDGVEVATAAPPSDMNKPMYMLVNLAVGGTWPGSPPSNFTTAQMEVDYVRAYSLASLGLTSTGAPISSSSSSAQVAVTAPGSTADAYAAKAGSALTVNAAQGVLANDTDHNGLTLSAALAANGGPSHGSLVLNADGSFTYTPTAGYVGADSFTYIASDLSSSGTPTTVTLTVGSTAPTAVADAYAVKAGAGLSETAAQGVLANDVDNNGMTLTAALAANGGPSHGTLTLNANGSFTYTPVAGFAGTDSFTYVASDGLSSGAPITVTLNVGATAPTAAAGAYGVKTNGSITESAAQGVLAKDIDHNGLTLTAALASNGAPAHGSLALNADGSFTYTPNAGYAGTDSFTYIASDGLSSSAPTTVTLNVSAAPIVVHSAAYSLRENAPVSKDATGGVLSFDSDNNGLTLSASLTANGGPSHGTLVFNADGSFTYTPTTGYYGSDSFTYVASDGATTSAPITVGLKVTPLLAVSHTDYFSVQAGNPLSVAAATGVLANDTDPNGLTLSAALAVNGGPAHGTVSLNADGSFSYVPTAGYVGADSFKYVASDTSGAGAVTTVNLTVTASAATGTADSYAVAQGSTLNVSAIKGVLAGDVDHNGLTLTANLTNGPTHGSLTLDANGSFSYTPVAGFVGTDSFKYVPTDGLTTGYGTTVTINVTAAGTVASSSAQSSAAYVTASSNDQASGAANTIDSAFSYSLIGTNAHNLILTGTGNINATANNLGDSLTGNSGDNVLTAGAGGDTLTGGGGHDIFVVGPGQQTVTITDFLVAGGDKIDVSAYLANGASPVFTDAGTYSTVSFSSGETIKLLGVHASSLELAGHYIV